MSKNLHLLFRLLKLAPEAITNVYLVGSRLWGTNKHSSDFDLLVITESPSEGMPSSQHKDHYDVTVLTTMAFSQRVSEGSIIETVCCMIDPREECVWQAKEPMRHLVKDVHTVEGWVAARHLKDQAKAQKFWEKETQESGFKILQHMIMAECLVQTLKEKEAKTVGGLPKVILTLEELQEAVRRGRRSEDWEWLGLPWKDVEKAHSARLLSIRSQ